MANGVDNDFVLTNLIKDRVGIRKGHYPPDMRSTRSMPSERVTQKQLHYILNAALHIPGAPRVTFGDIVKRPIKLPGRWRGDT